MTRYFLRQAFAHPEMLRRSLDENGNELLGKEGKVLYERVPGHPVRAATVRDTNTWEIEVSEAEAFCHIAAGHLVREEP